MARRLASGAGAANLWAMMVLRLFLSAMALVLWSAPPSIAETLPNILPMNGQIATDGGRVALDWLGAEPPGRAPTRVNRRLYGQTGSASWQRISPALGAARGFADETTRAGTAYEYQVLRGGPVPKEVGYWVAGVEIPATDLRGRVYLVVDEEIAAPLALRLERYARDLTGDGWSVIRHDAARGTPGNPRETLKRALTLKTWLQGQYRADPFGQHVVVLVGHLPLVRTGMAAPDGHTPEPHASDLFYAEMDGTWVAHKDGFLLNNHVPTDRIEMQIGRIDFSGFNPGPKRGREIALLRAYFDKNHHWRMGLHGDLRNAYGKTEHLSVERAGLRNIVGPQAITPGGHHGVGERNPALWGVDFGDWSGQRYAQKYRNKAIFAINFGSGKQKIHQPFNAMAALLAQRWYPLAVGWGGRPAWWLHHMALGGTIGDVHFRTVNNGAAQQAYRETMEYFPTGRYLWRNPPWVNLLGDPTLRGFVLAPARAVTAAQTAEGMVLTWDASTDPDTLGYRIYRAPEGRDDFTALNPGALVEGLRFTDPNPAPGARYMVRAYGLKRVHAGSFYTYAQGAYARSGPPITLAMDETLKAVAGQPLQLPERYLKTEDGLLCAFITGPGVGQLKRVKGAWEYTPPVDFTGDVPLRTAVSDAVQTETGQLTITVVAPDPP